MPPKTTGTGRKPIPIIDRTGRNGKQDSFPLFAKLPPEVRCMIWRAAMPDAETPAIYQYDERWRLQFLKPARLRDAGAAAEALIEIAMPGLAWANREARACLTAWMARAGVKMRFRKAKGGHCLARPWRSETDALYVGFQLWDDFCFDAGEARWAHLLEGWEVDGEEEEGEEEGEEEEEEEEDGEEVNGEEVNGEDQTQPQSQGEGAGQEDDEGEDQGEDDQADGASDSLLRYNAMMGSVRHLALPAFKAYWSHKALAEDVLCSLRNIKTLHVLFGTLPEERMVPQPDFWDPNAIPPAPVDEPKVEVQNRWELGYVDGDDQTVVMSSRDPMDGSYFHELGDLHEWMDGVDAGFMVSELPAHVRGPRGRGRSLPMMAAKAVRVKR
ncbi:hypothetical protein HIM_00023 [Hirsutella minnesotensis 3608]|nr:hypothetical protein HIM_00023 [Hirsutella minnesotensis 3608]